MRSSACALVSVNGLSTTTCRPASRAARASSWCDGVRCGDDHQLDLRVVEQAVEIRDDGRSGEVAVHPLGPPGDHGAQQQPRLRTDQRRVQVGTGGAVADQADADGRAVRSGHAVPVP